METIDFLLMENTQEIACGRYGRMSKKRRTVRIQKECWRGMEVRLHRIPQSWYRYPERIREYVDRQHKEHTELWTDSGLDSLLKGTIQPLPSAFLAAVILREQPFRPVLVLRCGQQGMAGWWETFLEPVYGKLKALYLLGEQGPEEWFLEKISEDSGLLPVRVMQMPEIDGRRCAVVDLQRGIPEKITRLPGGCLYVDLASDPEKERYFSVKRRDISYISARKYLDTALKTRYNAF